MIKLLQTLFIVLTVCTVAMAQPAYFNEIHYDNSGSNDIDERIEVAVPNPGNSYTNLYVFLYNGTASSRKTYDNKDYFDVGTKTTVTGGDVYVYTYPTDGIQNGAPDGMALVADYGLPTEKVLQFLSYEGSFTAADGPANGMTSVDIGVSESNSTPVGYSLQFNRTTQAWDAAAANTFGALNTNQTTLPLRFLSFTALNRGNQVAMGWQTAAERNVSHFAVERSDNGRAFRTIGQVDASGIDARSNRYSYTDRDPLNGVNYYRITGIDNDGTTTISSVVPVRVDKGRIELHATAQGEVTISAVEVVNTLRVYDTQGQIVYTGTIAPQDTLQLPEEIQNGLYVMTLQSGQDIITEKLILQR